jgi:Na+/phosphate symporter
MPVMIIYVSLLVCLIGVLMYALASNPKLVEIGRICFAFGLLAFLLRATDSMVDVIRR